MVFGNLCRDPTAEVHLSKSLSRLLRHRAVEEGLPISTDGYVPVDCILEHKSVRRYTKEDIFRVVQNNDKKRYTLKYLSQENKWMIKANQGHSIAEIEDNELIPITEPIYKTVIHGTFYKCWPQIRSQGLSRMNRNHIHFAKGVPEDDQVITGIKKSAEIHIYIDLQKALSDGLRFFESANGVILTRGDDYGYLKTEYFLKVIDKRTGYPDVANRSDLKLLFSKYGSATVEHMNQQLAVVRFAEPRAMQRALAETRLQFRGHQLRVQIYHLSGNKDKQKKNMSQKMDFTRSKEKNNIIKPEELELSGDFHSQLDHILTSVRLTQQEVTQLARLYSDIEEALREHWPGCITYPFGSITTGLGIKSSDADCFVSGAGRGDQSALSVNKAKSLLKSRPDLFAELFAIPRANTPIVKLFHLPTQTNCDLSFKTPLGTQNSRLIAFLLHCDPKLIPISVCLKYWGKVLGLTGTGKMSNYALTMLVIFYLQQLNILPAVEWLQRDPNYRLMIDGWNTGFMDNPQYLPPARAPYTISQILGGFFEFYANFNFAKYVVCPYLGKPIEKELFAKPDNLPDVFVIYKMNVTQQITLPLKITSAMCVQDPFELCHNVASTVSTHLAAEILAYINFAAEAYEKDKNDECKDFLKHILLGKPKLEDLPKKKHSKSNRQLNLRLKFKQELTQITNPDWRKVVRNAMFTVFENMLKMKLTKINANEKGDAMKDKYRATITRALWRRAQFDRLYKVMKFDSLEREQRITDEILRVDKNEINIPIVIRLFLQKDSKSCVLLVKLDTIETGDKEMFREFVAFGRNTLFKWFSLLFRVCNADDKEYNITENGGMDDLDESTDSSDESTSDGETKVVPRVWYSKNSETNTSLVIKSKSDKSLPINTSTVAGLVDKNVTDRKTTTENERNETSVTDPKQTALILALTDTHCPNNTNHRKSLNDNEKDESVHASSSKDTKIVFEKRKKTNVNSTPTESPTHQCGETEILTNKLSEINLRSNNGCEGDIKSKKSSKTDESVYKFSEICKPDTSAYTLCEIDIRSDDCSKTDASANKLWKTDIKNNKCSKTNALANKLCETGIQSEKSSKTDTSANKICEADVQSDKCSKTDALANKLCETGIQSEKSSKTDTSANKICEADVQSDKCSKTDALANKLCETGIQSEKSSKTDTSANKICEADVQSDKCSKTDASANKLYETDIQSKKSSKTDTSANKICEADVQSDKCSKTDASTNKLCETDIQSKKSSKTDTSVNNLCETDV